ncbi:EF-hand calcium-binding domain-containing protein 1 [Puma concolor]|uniref:EF-hand calcium-binding domain-containing protein 1 n=1 Tax=Puma concolor TaxID=9696 RepID=A0A6P6HRE6_PUMCO|nr:EF-hand calcium-binding domain-containing protein 1 [Puma concolor]
MGSLFCGVSTKEAGFRGEKALCTDRRVVLPPGITAKRLTTKKSGSALRAGSSPSYTPKTLVGLTHPLIPEAPPSSPRSPRRSEASLGATRPIPNTPSGRVHSILSDLGDSQCSPSKGLWAQRTATGLKLRRRQTADPPTAPARGPGGANAPSPGANRRRPAVAMATVRVGTAHAPRARREPIGSRPGLNKFEVQCLINLFYNLVGDVTERQGMVTGLDRNAFRNILHMTFGMTDDMIMDRVFRGFDKDNDGCVNVSEWISGLSVFLRGTLEEKMKYCFEVFDLNGDGFISKEEMFHMLKNSLLKQPSEEDPDEGIKDLVEITLKKMDHDHDGKLSFSDYEQAVREETLLLEAFGPCLPDPKSEMEFEAQVFKDLNEFNDI